MRFRGINSGMSIWQEGMLTIYSFLHLKESGKSFLSQTLNGNFFENFFLLLKFKAFFSVFGKNSGSLVNNVGIINSYIFFFSSNFNSWIIAFFSRVFFF